MDYGPDDPRAIKLLVSDNEIGHLAEVDDRALADLLREVKESDDDEGLLGTGYDEMMLANLAFVTRPASEIKDFNAAAEWVGMPDYDPIVDPFRLVVSFTAEADRDAFLELIGGKSHYHRRSGVWTLWWPLRERDDLVTLKFQQEEIELAPE
jgi:hypothetical protein